MTLTESDLSELLAAVQAGEMTETIRTSVAWVLRLPEQMIMTVTTAQIGQSRSRSAQRRDELINQCVA